MKQSILVFAVCILTFVSAGINAAPKNDTPALSSHTPPGENSSQENTLLSGIVVETMNASGYTYVSIEKNGKRTWVAVPMTKVKVGQEISFQPGVAMGKFTSKTLNRTFDNVIFSGGLASQPGPAGSGMPANTQHGGAAAAASKLTEKIGVEKASGPDAYTVGEVYDKRAALNNKNVVVNGKVVKVSEGIMGKNWVHVQDGTGDAIKKTYNLVVTSDDLPAVGDVVSVKGTVTMDKDFGAGYKYNVIIEKASISKK